MRGVGRRLYKGAAFAQRLKVLLWAEAGRVKATSQVSGPITHRCDGHRAR